MIKNQIMLRHYDHSVQCKVSKVTPKDLRAVTEAETMDEALKYDSREVNEDAHVIKLKLATWRE